MNVKTTYTNNIKHYYYYYYYYYYYCLFIFSILFLPATSKYHLSVLICFLCLIFSSFFAPHVLHFGGLFLFSLHNYLFFPFFFFLHFFCRTSSAILSSVLFRPLFFLLFTNQCFLLLPSSFIFTLSPYHRSLPFYLLQSFLLLLLLLLIFRIFLDQFFSPSKSSAQLPIPSSNYDPRWKPDLLPSV